MSKVCVSLIVVLSFVILETAVSAATHPDRSYTKIVPQRVTLKQCFRVGQKHCRVDAPGYSGHCLIKGKHGHKVIFYKIYPKKVNKIKCVIQFPLSY